MANKPIIWESLANKGRKTFMQNGIQPLSEPPVDKHIFFKNNCEYGKTRKDYFARVINYDPEQKMLEIQILVVRKRRVSYGEHNCGNYSPWAEIPNPGVSILSLSDFKNSTPYLVPN